MAFLVAGYGEGSYWESSPGFGSPSSEFEASYSGDSVNACEYAGKKKWGSRSQDLEKSSYFKLHIRTGIAGNEAHVLG